VGSSKTLTLSQLATNIPDTINYCQVEAANARYCTTYATVPPNFFFCIALKPRVE